MMHQHIAMGIVGFLLPISGPVRFRQYMLDYTSIDETILDLSVSGMSFAQGFVVWQVFNAIV